MNQTFLIPAGNSKKQNLIFGFLTTVDAIVLAIGIIISFIFLITLPIEQVIFLIIALAPIVISAALVFPIPNYVNSRILIMEIFKFYTGRRKYVWRGWCYTYEQSESEFEPNAKLK